MNSFYGPDTRHPSSGQKVVYLAAPYTHPEKAIREQRFRAATEAAAALIRTGVVVYSPITMTHPIDVVLAGDASTLGSEYWLAFDEAFMSFCSEMVVLLLDGWKESQGVRREIAYFKRHGKLVRFLGADHRFVDYDDSK